MKYVLRRPISLIAEFLRLESAAGLLLMAAAALALVLANSPAAPVYHAALSVKMGLPDASLSLLHWINDGLMAIFFSAGRAGNQTRTAGGGTVVRQTCGFTRHCRARGHGGACRDLCRLQLE